MTTAAPTLHSRATSPRPNRALPLLSTSPRPLGAAALLISVGVMAFAPLAVLAPTIGWPASLGLPPAEQLALVHAHPDAVRLGYALYLAYSLGVTPALLLLAHHTLGSLSRPAAATVVMFAALSSLARAIGISRWLTVMPTLAAAWAAAEPASRPMIELNFQTLTAFGGGIGEVLGVSLFMAVAVGVLSVATWRDRTLPRAISALGLLSAVFLGALSLPELGLPLDFPVALAVSTQSVWLTACSAMLLRRGWRTGQA